MATLQRLRWVVGPVIALLAAGALWRQVHGLPLAQLRAAWSATSTGAVAWSLLATAISFTCLADYERVATARVAPGRIPFAVAWRVGFMSHAIASTLFLHALTGAALRYRFYRDYGLAGVDVARVVAVVAACVAVGVVALAASALLWAQFNAGGPSRTVMAATPLLLLGLWLALRFAPRGGLRDDSSWLPIVLRAAATMSLLGIVEMTAAIGALYVLLPAGSGLALAPFALLYIGAMLLGIISHVPGGIGVFEAAILTGLPAGRHAEVLVALLLYRVLYNLLPFALATTVLLFESVRSRPLVEPIGTVQVE